MYSNNGKQLLFVEGGASVHIADCANDEAAHALATGMNARSGNYITNAARTLSPSWHGSKVAKAQFLGRINGAIDAANKLDQIKKTLFYGRDNNLIADGQAELGDAMLSAVQADVIHGIIGVFTEAGELLEALRDGYNGDGIDAVNIKEEIGDLFWYVAILAKVFDVTFEEIHATNIAKLQLRFPKAFEADYANNRDLAGERAVLEGAPLPVEFDGLTLSEAPAVATEGGFAMEPTDRASGPEAVAVVEAKSDAAFGLKSGVVADGVDAPATRGGAGNDLHLSPAERVRELPGEHLAHQPIRPEDE